MVFEQQLYENFVYEKPETFFHTFETDEYIAGLSFASNNEANKFYNSVLNCASSIYPQQETF